MEADRTFTFRIEQRDGYVVVHQRGAFRNAAEINALQAAILKAMRHSGATKALFDNRQTDAAPEELRAQMWTWLTVTDQIQRVALILESVRVGRRTNKTAARNRVTLQAFDSEEAAVAWLIDPVAPLA